MSVIPTLGRLRQEDGSTFEASHIHIPRTIQKYLLKSNLSLPSHQYIKQRIIKLIAGPWKGAATSAGLKSQTSLAYGTTVPPQASMPRRPLWPLFYSSVGLWWEASGCLLILSRLSRLTFLLSLVLLTWESGPVSACPQLLPSTLLT